MFITGTLGFFTDYQKDEITELIAAIKADHYQMTPRHLLEVDVYHKAGKETYLALNEMRIDHGYTTQVIDVILMMSFWKYLEEMVFVFLHHQDRRLIISQLVELLFIQEVP